MTSVESCPLTLRIIRSVSEVGELRENWSDWQSNPLSDIDNYLSMVGSRPEIERPHVMAVYRGGILESILIGRLERMKIPFTLGYLKVFQPQVRTLCFAQGSFLGNQSAENSEFVTRELVKCLGRGEADIARFEYVGVDSPLFAAVKGVRGVFCRDRFVPAHPHGSLRLPGSYEEFFGGLPRKERHNLKRYEKRVNSDFPGKMRIQSFRLESQIEELVRTAEEVASKTYQRGLGVGFQNDFETCERLRTAARKGALRGCVLYLGDRPCAFMIGVQYRRALHGTAMAYDPQYTVYSLGSLLLMHWIREAFETNGAERISEIDLGPGEGRHKRALNNHMWQESLVYIFAPSARGLLFNCQKTSTCLIDCGVKKLFLNSGFLEKIKNAWRSRLLAPARAAAPKQVPVRSAAPQPSASEDTDESLELQTSRRSTESPLSAQ